MTSGPTLKHSVCVDHNNQLLYGSIKNDGTRCYICDLENRLKTIALMFRGITLEAIQKAAPEVTEENFKDFEALIFGGI